jgi:hypothetical protein
MHQFEGQIITDLVVALELLDRHDGVDGVLCTDDETGAYIAERVHREGSSGSDYSSTTGRRRSVSTEIVSRLKLMRLVEPVILMGPLHNQLEISVSGLQWLRRELYRRTRA